MQGIDLGDYRPHTGTLAAVDAAQRAVHRHRRVRARVRAPHARGNPDRHPTSAPIQSGDMAALSKEITAYERMSEDTEAEHRGRYPPSFRRMWALICPACLRCSHGPAVRPVWDRRPPGQRSRFSSTEPPRGFRRRKRLGCAGREVSRTRVIVPAPNVARCSEIRSTPSCRRTSRSCSVQNGCDGRQRTGSDRVQSPACSRVPVAHSARGISCPETL